MGLKALEKVDEPTILLSPDAVLLPSETDLYTLQQRTLSQCAKLQDRVGVFDLWEKTPNATLANSVSAFRDGIGINNLKYGAAYTPWVISSFPRTVDFDLFRGSVSDSSGTLTLANLTSDSDLNALVSDAEIAIGDRGTVTTTIDTLRTDTGPDPDVVYATLKDRYKALKDAIEADAAAAANPTAADAARRTAFQALLGFLRTTSDGLAAWRDGLTGTNLGKDRETYAASTLQGAIESLIGVEKEATIIDHGGDDLSDLADDLAVDSAYDDIAATGWLSGPLTGIGANGANYTATGTLDTQATIQAILPDLDALFQAADGSILSFIEQVRDAAAVHATLAQDTLYEAHPTINNIVETIKREMSRVPPSGAIAGVYAFVDDSRGVWKSPANVSLSSVLGPTVAIDDAEQEDLNVDATAGKSVNAIRSFSGRGTVVWGARTLAGNDNEWRYVSVRRFFNMVEESVKKSTAWAVFEPNAAPLWTRLKGMIDNFLIQKWREGALAGAVPDEAFFVKVGLGQTMTAQDILEGRLNIEIGMAVVRPAEFIILKFSHKMQES